MSVDYQPRRAFLPYHERDQRWSCIVAHRRAGKTVATVFDLLTAALSTRKESARYAYIAPYYAQAKAIAWDYLKRFGAPIASRVLESELAVDLPNGARVRLFGADNPDALRGIYLDGAVLDEYGDQRPSVWGEIIRPLLTDRKGWATFIGTPKGKNHFYDVREMARGSEDWQYIELRASETGILDAAELTDARKQMTDAQYQQEFECAFDVPALGAVYAVEYQAARDTKRIGVVPHSTEVPVHTFWDLGIGDNTSIWFGQFVGGQIRLIDYYENKGEGLQHYVNVLHMKPYTYGSHYAPHDIAVKELGSGKSRLETAQGLGINFQIAPKLTLEDGINAVRMAFNRFWFDETKCRRGLECISNYRRELNEKLGEFKAAPVHDWASHGADALRYLAVSSNLVSNDSWGGVLSYPKLNHA